MCESSAERKKIASFQKKKLLIFFLHWDYFYTYTAESAQKLSLVDPSVL